MRKTLSTLALLATLSMGANAEAVSPYKLNFNSKIATVNHDFACASSWEHAVDYYVDYSESVWGEAYYVKYSWGDEGGIDNSGCLTVQTQTDLDYGRGSVKDLLVTPVITGKASIYVRQQTLVGDIKFYKVNLTDDGYTAGDEITGIDVSGLNTDDFVKIELPAQEGERIGIWGSQVTLDDFEAESAEVTTKRSLAFLSGSNIGNINPYCDENNQFTVAYAVTVQNNGDVPLTVGDAGYSLSLVNYTYGNVVVGTKPFSKSLEVGESLTDTISVKVNYADFPERSRYDVRENIGGYGYTTYPYYEPIPYAPIMQVSNGTGDVDEGDTFDYGKVSVPTSSPFTISSKGGKPLTVTSIDVPEGYTVDVETPFTIGVAADSVINLTLSAETEGTYAGNVTIKADELEPFTFAVTGRMLDADKWNVTFENKQLPVGSQVEGTDWEVVQIDYSGEDNMYALKHYNASEESKFISPLLTVEEGEVMTFEVGRSSKSSSNCSLRIYYSADGENWTLAKEVDGAALPSTSKSNYGSYSSLGTLAEFTLDKVPAGNYYIGFAGRYVYIDNLYGYTPVDLGHNLQLDASKLPTKGMINVAYTGTVSATNQNVCAENADTYTATLYFDDEPVATAESETILSGETAAFTFAYTPHTIGAYNAYVVFENEADDYLAVSDTVVVNIGEEIGAYDVQTVEVSSTSRSDAVPVSLYNKNSASDAIYDADMLAAIGLKKGDKLTKIYYKGYNTTGSEHTVTLKAWVRNTSATGFEGTYALPDTTAMTEVYNGEYTFATDGTSAETAPLLELSLDEPFVYDGEGLEIFVTHTASGWKAIYFEYNSDKKHCYSYANDATGLGKAYLRANYLPVAYFSVMRDAVTLTGNVTSTEGKAVADATVTLTCGDVYYTTQTATDGSYALTVIQTDKQYELTAAAEGYESYTDSELIDMTTTTVKDIVLKVDEALGITEAPVNGSLDENQPMFNTAGQRVGKAYRGVVVQNGRKFIRK